MDSLKKIDFLGNSPSFLYEDKQTYTSRKGGFLSFLVFIASLICVYFFGVKLILSELNSVTFAKIYQNSPPPLPFKEQGFAFYFGVTGENYLHTYREDLLTVKFRLETRQANGATEVAELDHKECELSDFGDAHALFESTDYKNTYCLAKNHMDEINLNSTFGQDNFIQIVITVETCKNSTTVQNCAPQAEIDAYADGFIFDFAFTKDIVDPNNYENPGNKYFEDYFASASQNYSKMVVFYFSHIFVDSDVGWIFEENRRQSFFNLGAIKENLELKKTNHFLRLDLRLDREAGVWTRKYYKLQYFIAELGGVIKGFMIFGKVMMFPFSETEMIVEAINKASLASPGQHRGIQSDANQNDSNACAVKQTRTLVEVGFFDAILRLLPCISTAKKNKISSIKQTYRSAMNLSSYLLLLSMNTDFLNQERRPLRKGLDVKIFKA